MNGLEGFDNVRVSEVRKGDVVGFGDEGTRVKDVKDNGTWVHLELVDNRKLRLRSNSKILRKKR